MCISLSVYSLLSRLDFASTGIFAAVPYFRLHCTVGTALAFSHNLNLFGGSETERARYLCIFGFALIATPGGFCKDAYAFVLSTFDLYRSLQ